MGYVKPLVPVFITLLALALFQFLAGGAPFFVNLATLVGVNVILAVSLNLINGITGQFSIGHAGFMAVGAYVSGALALELKENTIGFLPEGLSDQVIFLSTLLAGGVAAGLCGFLVGLPSLRLKGDYLAIVTLGFGEIIRIVFQNSESLGGSLGLVLIPQWTSLFMVWFWVFVVCLVSYRLLQSSHGRRLLAIREDEFAAETMGVNTTAYKVRAFVLSSFFAGIAGGLFAGYLTSITPATFNFVRSMDVVVMVVAGGLGSTTGAFVAAVCLSLLPEGMRTVLQAIGGEDQSLASKVEQFRMPIYGLLLVLIMLTRPQGIFGTGEVWDLFKKKKTVSGEAKA
jgi:branched-chain amino acid transport system permease protein